MNRSHKIILVTVSSLVVLCLCIVAAGVVAMRSAGWYLARTPLPDNNMERPIVTQSGRRPDVDTEIFVVVASAWRGCSREEFMDVTWVATGS